MRASVGTDRKGNMGAKRGRGHHRVPPGHHGFEPHARKRTPESRFDVLSPIWSVSIGTGRPPVKVRADDCSAHGVPTVLSPIGTASGRSGWRSGRDGREHRERLSYRDDTAARATGRRCHRCHYRPGRHESVTPPVQRLVPADARPARRRGPSHVQFPGVVLRPLLRRRRGAGILCVRARDRRGAFPFTVCSATRSCSSRSGGHG